ncbi:phosphoglycerate mutase-like protein [Xylariaceae sp. FL0594]|nr:phosphoglycerate mutase-like protein [Xylariaceae sp. FL0594]
MSLQVIYVTRHGFRSAWSVDHVTGTYSSYLRSPTGVPTDPALTSHGVEQADDLAEHLLAVDPPIDCVYSSPYYRCLQTISPFVSRHKALKANPSSGESLDGPGSHIRIRVESGLGEWHGRAHFEHPTAAPLSELSGLFADLDASYVSSPAPRRHGESIPQLYERVASCMRAIIARCDREGKKAVLVCTHAAVVIALGRILTGNTPEDPSTDDFGAFTCGLSVYHRQKPSENVAGSEQGFAEKRRDIPDGTRPSADDGPMQTRDLGVSSQWTCVANSDCSFLRSGEERGWRFSGDESFVETDGGVLQPSLMAPIPGPAHEKKRNALDGTGTSKL